MPPAMTRYFERTIPAARLSLIPGAGHLMYVDRWREIVAFLVAW